MTEMIYKFKIFVGDKYFLHKKITAKNETLAIKKIFLDYGNNVKFKIE